MIMISIIIIMIIMIIIIITKQYLPEMLILEDWNTIFVTNIDLYFDLLTVQTFLCSIYFNRHQTEVITNKYMNNYIDK